MLTDATADTYSESALVAHSAELKIEDDTVPNGGCSDWMAVAQRSLSSWE